MPDAPLVLDGVETDGTPVAATKLLWPQTEFVKALGARFEFAGEAEAVVAVPLPAPLLLAVPCCPAQPISSATTDNAAQVVFPIMSFPVGSVPAVAM